VNIDAAKRRAKKARDFADGVVETLHDPLLFLDPDLRVKRVRAIFCRMFQVIRNDTGGRFLCDLDDGQGDIPQLCRLLEEILLRNSAFNNFVAKHAFPRIENKQILLNARRILGTEGEPTATLPVIGDITQSGTLAA
jgi:two-component system CheB/CheR fusion protein